MQNDKYDPLLNRRAPELIATYEELHGVPSEKRITHYFGDIGAHHFNHGVEEDAIRTAYKKALAAIRMDSEQFLKSKDFVYRGGIIARMMDCMLKDGSRLQDVASWGASNSDLFVVHEEGNSCIVPVEGILSLTEAGRESFSALLRAEVKAVRLADHGIELVISGVVPQELARFRDACEAHGQSEQGMWMMEARNKMDIQVLKFTPGQLPEAVTMPNTLEAFQEAVGGDIETVGLDANVALVCNEAGKLMGLPANRQVGGDTIAGTFLIVGAEDGDFCSLSDGDAAHYAVKFAEPMPVQEGPTTWEFHAF